MPISTPDFEFLTTTLNVYPDIIINTAPVSTSSTETTDVLTNYVLPDEDHAFLHQGDVLFKISSAAGNSIIVLAPDSIVGSGGTAIQLFGGGQNILGNFGSTVLGNIKFGGGSDLFANAGYVEDGVKMGAGDDYLINASYDFGSGEVFGFIGGDVMMGSGDDFVLNSATLGMVNLGTGNDFYGSVNSDLSLQNYDDPDTFAAEVIGGRGQDTMFGGANDDRFFGGADEDVLNGHGGNDRLFGQNGMDTLRGGNDNDRLYGGKGKDMLDGGNGRDMLNGGSGQDVLTGGRGDDKLIGGSGADVFVFSGNSGADVITDFNVSQDVVELPFAFFAFVGAYDDAAVLSYITYADGDAVLDLSGLYQDYGLTDEDGFSARDGISITFLGVNEGDLSGDNFLTPGDFVIVDEPVVIL